MTYYMRGQSDYDSVNFHMGLFFDMNGFASGDYATIVMPDDVTQGDPFFIVAAETIPTWTPGSQNVEIGLWDDYRIKIDSAGIWGWHEGSGDWFSLFGGGGGGGALVDLTDVVINTPTDNEVLAYDNGTSKWINQTATEASLATAGHGHGQLHDQNHDNTDHTTDYEPAFSKNQAFNKDWGTTTGTVAQGDDSRFHSPTVAGDLNLNDLAEKNHASLANKNAETNFKHLTDAQQSDLHTIYSLEQHDNAKHSTNYEVANANIQGHVASPATDAHHTKYTNAEAVSAVEAVGLSLATTKVITSPDEDLEFYFGRAQIGDSSFSDWAIFGHRDAISGAAYALGQTNDGNTYINAKVGTSVYFNIDGGSKMVMDASALTMSVPIAMGTNKITGLGNATTDADALNRITADGRYSLGGHGHGQLHDESHTLASHSTKAHSELSDAPTDAHHAENHNNTYHSTNYHTEADGTGVATVHSDITSVGSGSIITTGERNNLHDIYTLETHAGSHEDTGGDEINVGGLSGQLADGQIPISHNNTYHSVTFVDATGAVSAVNATGLALATTKVITSANENLEFLFGKLRVDDFGYGASYVGLSHRVLSGGGNYGILFRDNGTTYVNAADGESVLLMINNGIKVQLTNTELTMSVPIVMNSVKITGLTAGSATGEAVAYQQLHAETHVLATSGPHSDSLPLTDLASYAAQGDLIFGGATDWGVLTKGSSGKYLKAGATTISWEDAPGAPIETGSTFPVSPVDGQTYYDHEDECTYIYSSTAQAWVQIGGAGVGGGTIFQPPIGYISMYSGTWTDNVTIPGWYKCDGNNGTVNLVGKFVRGGTASGATGGSDDAVVVSHKHQLRSVYDPNASGTDLYYHQSTIVAFDDDDLMQSTGVSGVDKNIPAYYTLIFIQRIS